MKFLILLVVLFNFAYSATFLNVDFEVNLDEEAETQFVADVDGLFESLQRNAECHMCHMTSAYVAILKYYGSTDDKILAALKEICDRKKTDKAKARCEAFITKYAKEIVADVGQKIPIKTICEDKLKLCHKKLFY